jgi:hypothetical protein
MYSLTDKHDPIAKRENDLLVNRHKKRLLEIRHKSVAPRSKDSLTKRKFGELHDYQGQVNKYKAQNL